MQHAVGNNFGSPRILLKFYSKVCFYISVKIAKISELRRP